MLHFFRRIRRSLINSGATRKYLLYAVGEIALVVIGITRAALRGIDYDSLHDNANQHRAVRGILGVHTNHVFGEGKYYELQTIKDNVALLDEQILQAISEVVVKAGHVLKKTKAASKA